MDKKLFSGIIFATIIPALILIFSATGFSQMEGEAFMEMEDKNKDGKVSRDEFGGPPDDFDWFDKDKDGFIVLGEAPGGDNPPPPGGKGEPAGGAKSTKGKGQASVQVPVDAKPLYGQGFIKKFDFDTDGKVNHDEWEAIKPMTVYANNHWPEFDKNNDGFITIDEAPEPE